MKNKHTILLFLLVASFNACTIPSHTARKENNQLPAAYNQSSDTANIAFQSWRQYFEDPMLVTLIDSALKNNQELNILLQEIEMDKNEITARKGEYLPFVSLGGAAGIEKTGRYTWDGLSEEDLKAHPEKGPKHIGDFRMAAFASWELDVWKKLRNAKKSAALNYLSTIEGKNFMITRLIAEIAHSYYELLALDNIMEILQQNIELQTNALRIVKLEKEAAKVSQLAVNRFEAQLLHTRNLQYDIRQQIVETENRIHFLTGSFPSALPRNTAGFRYMSFETITAGIPSQLLSRRPDIRQAELNLAAAKLNVEVARANFLPSFRLTAGLGLTAFNPLYIVKPESILYNLAGDLVAPLVNRNAIKALYATANLRQTAAAYQYEQSILNAYIEVLNQLAQLDNYAKSVETKSKEVDILVQSIDISNKLFTSARADYIEVLLTQREALESKIELVEARLKQAQAKVNIYQALGGGWN